jgi:DNA-binding response OmpR family regulator
MKGYHILILEDDVITSVALAKALQTELPDSHILRAGTLFEARLLFSSFEIQFFLIDVHLPDGNGIDFVLDISGRNPKAAAVIMTAEPLPKYRDRAQSFGALYFFEKPVSPRTLGQIIRNHRAATYGASPGSDTSFTASLTRLSVVDVIQLKCLARATLRLDFTLKDGRCGSIYLSDGNIVHAEANVRGGGTSLLGLGALAQIVSWRGGKIDEVKGAEQPRPTITGEWQGLLLHAAQMADEASSAAAPAVPAVVPGGEGPQASGEVSPPRTTDSGLKP